MNLRNQADTLFRTAVAAADPYDTITRAVSVGPDGVAISGTVYPSDRIRRIVTVGMGKASARMGQALEDVLVGSIDTGWINTKYGHALPLSRIHVHECGHPVPDENGITGTERIIEILESADENTLVIGLISGGGSALSPAPAEGITLAEKQEITHLLLNAGADITELNAVRKHLSRLKGGGMARIAHPAAVHLLILSDVIGDRLDTIASGPAVADTTTFADCITICRSRGIWDRIPSAVRTRLTDGAEGTVPETVKLGDPCLESVCVTMAGSIRKSIEAARNKATGMGYKTIVLTSTLSGEARQAGNFFASLASEIQDHGDPVAPPACIIAGGETTVTVTGRGKGGRNMEMALSAAIGIEGRAGVVFLSGGTDGTDGPTDSAGGIVDGATVAFARSHGFDPDVFLADNDSYHFLRETDGCIMTGPTGTNVMDIQILLVDRMK